MARHALGDGLWETGLAANDMNRLAAERLEAAVERLAAALGAWRAAQGGSGTADMVPRAEVKALSTQLDDTLARLRGALDDQDG